MEEKKTLQDEEEPQVEQFGEPLHVFAVEGGGMYWVLESQLPPEERGETPLTSEKAVFSEHDTQPLNEQIPRPAPAAPRIGVLLPWIMLLSNGSIILLVLFFHLTQTVTITITPKSRQITADITIANLPSRIFSPLSIMQVKTLATTGKGYQQATEASGNVTFYNASPQEQIIASGTLLIGADGVQIVTNQTAYLPGSTPPTETQFTVQAHAVNAGKAGNMHAGDITGACCKAGVYVANSAFSGGQDSRTYSIVTRQDIQNVVATLQPAVNQTITATFEKQVQPTETLVQPQCSQIITPSHQAGDEAQTVTVTVRKSCIAGAYTTNALQAAIVVERIAITSPTNQEVLPTEATLRDDLVQACKQGVTVLEVNKMEYVPQGKEKEGEDE